MISVQDDAHTQLKKRTDSAHEEMHKHPALRQLFSDQLSSKNYHQLLKCYLTFYQQIEKQRINLDCCDRFSLQSFIRNLSLDTNTEKLELNSRTTFATVKTAQIRVRFHTKRRKSEKGGIKC